MSNLQQYSDLNFLFKINPTLSSKGDISKVSGILAVKQSVMNILRTNHGERLFNPLFGANLRVFLFENITRVTMVAIANQIKRAIYQDEPRVNVLNVNIKSDAHSHTIDILLTVQVVATNEVVEIGTSLEKLR
jgi:hypothetical protein